jgi:hypothetical protein
MKNKLMALALALMGCLSTLIDGDVTALVLVLVVAVPLFFTRENYVHIKRRR